MDIDIFVERLAEHCNLLSRLQMEVQSAASEEEALLRHSALLNRLLHAERNIYPDIQLLITLLQATLQNSPTGLAVVSGPDLIFRLANPTYRSILPDPNMNLIGLQFGQVWPAELGYDGENLIRQVLQQDKAIHFERLELRFPDGLTHSYSLRICRMEWQNEEGALLLIGETTQADRARQLAMEIAEGAFQQAEELDAIIRAMAEAVIITDRQGKITKANPAAVDFSGLDPTGYQIGDIVKSLEMRYLDGSPVQPDDLPFQQAYAGEIITGCQLLFDSDDSEQILRISASPLLDEDRVAGVITVWHDVTEREQLLEQLEIEQSRLETIIENAPEAIIVADEEGRIVLGNPAAEQILGRELPYFQGFHTHTDLSICYADGTPYQPRNLPLTCSALDGERLNNIELQVLLPDGRIRYVLTSSAPIVDRKGNLNGAVGVFQDITQSKKTEETLRQQATRSQLLANLSQQFAEAGLHSNDLMNTIVEQVGKALGDLCSLYLFTDTAQELYLGAVYTADETVLAFIRDSLIGIHFPTNQGLVDEIIHSGQPLILSDVPLQKFTEGIPPFNLTADRIHLPKTVNAIIVPLRVHSRWIGILNLLRFTTGNDFYEDDKVFLQDLAYQAALAIEDARLFELESQRARELHALHQATTALLSTIDLETLLAEILTAAISAIPAANMGIVYLLSKPEGQLEIRATFGCSYTSDCVDKLRPLADETVHAKQPLLFQAISGIREEGAEQVETYSAITAPLMKPGEALGVLVLFGARPDLFTVSDLRLLGSFAATATAALQNATLYAEVQRLATTDTVTEQFNRRKFFELSELEIHRSRRFATPLSAIMFDLDNFKEINDTYGHAAGDLVLHTVAQRCRASIRVIDILGRYGGDEFAILLPDAEIVEAHEIAERIRQAVTSSQIQTDRGKVPITISLGVAQVDHKQDTLSSLLGRADAALYQAKQNGRNRIAEG